MQAEDEDEGLPDAGSLDHHTFTLEQPFKYVHKLFEAGIQVCTMALGIFHYDTNSKDVKNNDVPLHH